MRTPILRGMKHMPICRDEDPDMALIRRPILDVDVVERAARAELAAIDPALLDDEEWDVARANLLRFFALLQQFVEAETDIGERGFSPARSDKIRGS